MASCAWNIYTKDYQNLIICFQVTAKNVGDAFLGHSVVHSGFLLAIGAEHPAHGVWYDDDIMLWFGPCRI